MNEEEYINKRLLDQINWYSTKSQWNQKWFKRLKILEIVCAAIIPFLAGIGPVVPFYQFVIGFLGVIIAVSSGISSIYKFHENWIEYRTTAETLKHELYLFKTKSQPYDKENAFQELVQRVESLISKEHTQWSRYARKQKE
ncbi:MAG: DUF4231 domain-containing protein [Archaeoglobus sp.]|nr:DUF4231 domain-containing protein [Archaeoglobus sp.]